MGGEGESRESLDRLGELILASPLAGVQATISTPFPGTPLRRRLEAQGRILRERDWSHYTLFDVTIRPERMTVADLERGFADLLRRVFAPEAAERRRRICRRILRENAKRRS